MNAVKQKRILYVITKGNFGGAQRYVFELALASKANRASVAVVCGEPGLLTQKLAAHNITYIPLPAFQRDISLLKEIRAFFSLLSIFRSYKPDVVHLNSSKAGVLGSLAARLMRVPRIIFTAHGWPFLEQRSRTWRSVAWVGSYATALFAHAVIVVSENDYVKSHMPGVKGKLTQIHTAVPTFPLKSRAEARTILFDTATQKRHETSLWVVSVAELTANKNIAYAINAVAAYNAQHTAKVFYTVIGDGELRPELTQLIQTLHAQDEIRLVGYHDNARSLLSAFDVCVLPSLKEGLPYTLLEAGIAKLGVIASNVGGIPEVIIHNKTGLLCNPHEVTDMTAQIVLLTDRLRRERYAHALHEHVLASFSHSALLEQTLSHYITPPK